MHDEHPYVGKCLDGMDVYDLTCSYSETPADPMCGRPATTHLRIVGSSDESGAQIGVKACDEHAAWARQIGFDDEHPTAGSACAMPAALWVPGNPSKCVIDDSGVEPQLTITRELEAAR